MSSTDTARSGPVPAPIEALARLLSVSTADLVDALSGLMDEALARRPAPEEWSAWDIAYHVAQIEVWYIAKLCEAAAGGPAAALTRFTDVFAGMRARALDLVRALPPERLDAPGQLTGVPDWTPRDLVERMAAHDHEHAAQTRTATASIEPSQGDT
jgi:hypothetical protein